MCNATATWTLLDALIAQGYKKCWIAEQLGSKRALQLNRRSVTVANAQKVRALYNRLWVENAELRMRVDPSGERERERQKAEEFERKTQAASIARRWDDLFSELGAAQ